MVLYHLSLSVRFLSDFHVDRLDCSKLSFFPRNTVYFFSTGPSITRETNSSSRRSRMEGKREGRSSLPEDIYRTKLSFKSQRWGGWRNAGLDTSTSRFPLRLWMERLHNIPWTETLPSAGCCTQDCILKQSLQPLMPLFIKSCSSDCQLTKED